MAMWELCEVVNKAGGGPEQLSNPDPQYQDCQTLKTGDGKKLKKWGLYVSM